MADALYTFWRVRNCTLLAVAALSLLAPGLVSQAPPAASPAVSQDNVQMPQEVKARLDNLQSSLGEAESASNAKEEAGILNQIGKLYFDTSNYKESLDSYNQALKLAQNGADPKEEAAALSGAAGCLTREGQIQPASDLFQKALDLASKSGDTQGKAAALNGLGSVASSLGQMQKAMELHHRALLKAREAGDADSEATALRRLGFINLMLGDKKSALEDCDQALAIIRRTGNRSDEAATLAVAGMALVASGDTQKALDYYNQALHIAQVLGDRSSQVLALISLGDLYAILGEPQRALDSYMQSLPIARQTGAKAQEAAALGGVGRIRDGMGERREALQYFNLALPIFREQANPTGEAILLNYMGNLYFMLGDEHKSLEAYNESLQAWREVGNPGGEATELLNLGHVSSALGEKQEALEYYNQVLTITRQMDSRNGEAGALNNIGEVYSSLGRPDKAREYYEQALTAFRQLGHRDEEASALTGIGATFQLQGKPDKALEYYSQSLPIFREVQDRDREALVLSGMGAAFANIGKREQSVDSINQALAIFRSIGNRLGEALTLCALGNTYVFQDRHKALEYLNQALPLARGVDNPLLEANIFYWLMAVYGPHQPSLAIFFGKQAVNQLQRVRGNIQGLDKELQTSFLNANSGYYRDLASYLIDAGRLPEAQQVLDLLKQQEYMDYVRGASAKTLSPLTLTPAEKQAEEDYEKSTADLVSVGEQWAQLKRITSRAPDEEKRYQQLSDQLGQASKALNDYYTRLYVLFGKDSDANKQVADVKGAVRDLRQQIAKSPGAVALYTLVGKDRVSVIVITASVTAAREYAIPEKDLNQKIAAFEKVLRDPTKDPKPLAQELYNALIVPVKSDLDQAQAKTLVWSLDGVLRYIPISALYDGQHYLVERYNNVTITPFSIQYLSEKPDVGNLRAAAMGISLKYEDGLAPLPAVALELNEIVKNPQSTQTPGVLPGSILLDNQFTERAMEDQLGGRNSVVHIASHFVFRPGDDSASYLLLAGKEQGGQGFHLTVADFRDNQKLGLADTDLLTLSACETGVGGNASDGREVDGLGTTAQLKGAKAVISSLWSVNDASTGELMADFYRRWASGGGTIAKVEALRQAQLDLLLGKNKPALKAGPRGLIAANSPPPTSYSHPYYWAPFVLLGNWR